MEIAGKVKGAQILRIEKAFESSAVQSLTVQSELTTDMENQNMQMTAFEVSEVSLSKAEELIKDKQNKGGKLK